MTSSCSLCGITHDAGHCTQCSLQKQTDYANYLNYDEQSILEQLSSTETAVFSEPALTMCQAWQQGSKTAQPTSFTVTYRLFDFNTGHYGSTQTATVSLGQVIPTASNQGILVKKVQTGYDSTGFFPQYSFLPYARNIYGDEIINNPGVAGAPYVSVSPSVWIDYGSQPAGCTVSPSPSPTSTSPPAPAPSNGMSYTSDELYGMIAGNAYAISSITKKQAADERNISDLISITNNLNEYLTDNGITQKFDNIDVKFAGVMDRLDTINGRLNDPTTGLTAINAGLARAYQDNLDQNKAIAGTNDRIGQLADVVNHLANITPTSGSGGGILDSIMNAIKGFAGGGVVGILILLVFVYLIFGRGKSNPITVLTK